MGSLSPTHHTWGLAAIVLLLRYQASHLSKANRLSSLLASPFAFLGKVSKGDRPLFVAPKGATEVQNLCLGYVQGSFGRPASLSG